MRDALKVSIQWILFPNIGKYHARKTLEDQCLKWIIE